MIQTIEGEISNAATYKLQSFTAVCMNFPATIGENDHFEFISFPLQIQITYEAVLLVYRYQIAFF